MYHCVIVLAMLPNPVLLGVHMFIQISNYPRYHSCTKSLRLSSSQCSMRKLAQHIYSCVWASYGSLIYTCILTVHVYALIMDIVDGAYIVFVCFSCSAVGHWRPASIQKHVGEILQRSNSHCVSVLGYKFLCECVCV